jgi:hypothetical protein
MLRQRSVNGPFTVVTFLGRWENFQVLHRHNKSLKKMKKTRKKRPHFTWQPKIVGEAAIGLATLFGCIRLYLEVLGQFWWDHFGLAIWSCEFHGQLKVHWFDEACFLLFGRFFTLLVNFGHFSGSFFPFLAFFHFRNTSYTHGGGDPVL